MLHACDSCNLGFTDLRILHRSGGLQLCRCCYPWVRFSIRRTRKKPSWVRPSSSFSIEELSDMREIFHDLRSRNGRNWLNRRHIFDMGFPYLGPVSDIGWISALDNLDIGILHLNRVKSRSVSKGEVLGVENQLKDAGLVRFPKGMHIQEHVAKIMLGVFGKDVKNKLTTAIFIWLIGEDEFVARNPPAWARSFQFVQEVVGDLNERATIMDGYIEVIGASGNVYRIKPKRHTPNYAVFRELDEKLEFICIDPVGAHNVVFGDILVTLVLSLYDDTNSARHINTLGRHVFGTPERMRRRNVNIEHLWRRAIGNPPYQDNGQLTDTMQRFIRRFQTNLMDWTQEEEGA